MNENIKSQRTFLITLGIATIVVALIGATFAYWSWETTSGQRTAVSFTIGNGFSCSADGGGNITSSDVMLAPSTCTNSTYAIKRTVKVNTTQNAGKKIYLDMNLKVNSIGTGLAGTTNFKYALTTGSDSCTDGVVKTGNFSGATTNTEKPLLSNKEYATTTSNDTYYLWIWLDAAETSAATQNQTFNISLSGACTDETPALPKKGQPVLDSGLIPVKIANYGTVTTVTEFDDTWFDYDNKIWANAVLVKETGVKTRAENKVAGTVIDSSDILAYYVWIPRYKYAFPNANGSPETIDIVFETADTPKSTGTATGTSYYTHPAFTFGTTELEGIWVGKFEMSHETLSTSSTSNNLGCTNETCTNAAGLRILPNVKSLRNNNVSNMFYSLRSMEQSNNVFGISSSDSHMMKNSEWGAVAYLSHSNYGFNYEIRINNNNSYMTGCGTYTENGSSSSSCEINFGASMNPQSTTGNFSGIYDMSGGAGEYVMGNFDGTIGASGFNTLPDAKYYDNYPASVFNGSSSTNLTFCTLETCGGQALHETKNWYNDFTTFVYSSYPFFKRGGGYNNGVNTGIFAIYIGDGGSFSGDSFRGVLVAR